MRALASYILRGPMQAVLVTVTGGLLALLLPPVSYVSGGAVALVTLRQGPRAGLTVILGAAVAAALLGLLVVGSYLPVLVLLLVLWLPLWVLAAVLRQTVSLMLAVQAAALLGVAWVVLMHAVVHDPVQWWMDLLQTVKPALEQIEQGAELDRQLRALAQLMTGMVAAATVLSLLLNLFLARGWQALLFRPGGFKQEFYGLRLSPYLATIALALLAFALAGAGPPAELAADATWVTMSVFLLGGLALVHSLVLRLKAHVAWLVGLYALLTLDPFHGMPLLALLGLLDSWLNLRVYFPRGSES